MAGVSFDLPAGACLLVVGPSGSGKSSLARAIAGLIPASVAGRLEGALEVAGLAVERTLQSAVAARVGVVFQDPESQLVMDRVEDDVAFGLESRGWPRDAMRSRVPEALAALGLEGLERRRTTRLSGGQQQRLALAGALAPRPGVLVLDEPTANLDPAGAVALAGRLAALRAARTATIVLVEHRVEIAWPLADLVLALGADGRPIAFGAPAGMLAEEGDRLAAEGIWLPDAVGLRPAAELSNAGPAVAPRHAPASAPASAAGTLLDVAGLSFAYERGAPVLDGVDMALRAGERIALLGANGSGKSTLARLLVGLLRAGGGRIHLAGLDPARLPAARLAELVGFVFQDPEHQFVAATVAGEVMAGLDRTGRTHAADVAAALGLPIESFGDRSPYSLSGGEQRRLSLAAALVRRPRLLVLDEPTYGQDRHGYERLVALLNERVAEGTALVAATHDLRFVRDVAPRTVALDGGRVAWDGPTADLAARPELLAALHLPAGLPAGDLAEGVTIEPMPDDTEPAPLAAPLPGAVP